VTAPGTHIAPAARAAVPGDGPRLAVLVGQARAEFAEQRGGDVFNAREGRAEPVGDAPLDADAVWVGTLDQVVVGYAAARIETLRDGARLGVITDLFVEPDARAVGVGESLVGAVLSWSAAQGCQGVDAAALPGNRSAKNFFEEAGFTARLLIMHRRLDPSDGDG
jgi:ribosomal protein S18 acetylase RimI-like enzyme